MDWIKAGIAGLAVLAVYLVSIIGQPRQAPLPRSFALKALVAVVVVHLIAAAILPTRPDLSQQLLRVESNLGRATFAQSQLRSIETNLDRMGAKAAPHGTPLRGALTDVEATSDLLRQQAESLTSLGRELAARTSRMRPEHRTLFGGATAPGG